MVLALADRSRFWLGGVISRHRDLFLIARLVQRARTCTLTFARQVCVDGVVCHVTAFVKAFRQPIRTGRCGHPRLVLPDGLQFAQVINHSVKPYVVGGTRRVIHDTPAGTEVVLTATATGAVINTAYIEQLNDAFRAHLAPITRRNRVVVRTEAILTAGTWRFGTACNFCWPHNCLRQLAPDHAPRKWLLRPQPTTAGLADRCWTITELLRFQIPLPRWIPPKRRGRLPTPPSPGAVA